MKSFLRTAQSFFPWLIDAKFATQHAYRALRHRPFEPEFAVLGRLLPKDALCLDVGGNRGQSIQAIRMILPEARIVSFEPNPDLFGKLEAKLGGEAGIELRNEALGERPGSSTLYVPYYRGFMYDGLASLDEASARDWICPQRFWAYRPDWVSVKASRIEVVPLDSLRLAPDFIKIDVQGTELAVLRGGRETIARHRPVILCEAPDGPTGAFLEALGYDELRVVDGELVPGRGGLNSVFVARPSGRA
jgi:FkbM family methyltransferase